VEKANNISLWVEQGYTLFAEEGLEGIQIERLARILRLNKSGFYHYFADLEGYYEKLIKLHDQKIDLFVHEVGQAKKLDPDYLLVLIKNATTVMFQVQLTRNKNRVSFYNASKAVDERVDIAVHPMWGDYLDVHSNSDVALRYFHLVRDMFYTRISFENLNYEFLHNLAAEAKHLMNHIGQYKTQFDAHE
jgi:AcrR family transcriptional regulator